MNFAALATPHRYPLPKEQACRVHYRKSQQEPSQHEEPSMYKLTVPVTNMQYSCPAEGTGWQHHSEVLIHMTLCSSTFTGLNYKATPITPTAHDAEMFPEKRHFRIQTWTYTSHEQQMLQ